MHLGWQIKKRSMAVETVIRFPQAKRISVGTNITFINDGKFWRQELLEPEQLGKQTSVELLRKQNVNWVQPLGVFRHKGTYSKWELFNDVNIVSSLGEKEALLETLWSANVPLPHFLDESHIRTIADKMPALASKAEKAFQWFTNNSTHVPIHGDAYPHNFLETGDGPVLTDTDLLTLGDPTIDLLKLTYAEGNGWDDPYWAVIKLRWLCAVLSAPHLGFQKESAQRAFLDAYRQSFGS